MFGFSSKACSVKVCVGGGGDRISGMKSSVPLEDEVLIWKNKKRECV